MKIELPLSNFPYKDKPKFVIQGKFYEISKKWFDTIFLFDSFEEAEAFIQKKKNEQGGEWRVAANRKGFQRGTFDWRIE